MLALLKDEKNFIHFKIDIRQDEMKHEMQFQIEHNI